MDTNHHMHNMDGIPTSDFDRDQRIAQAAARLGAYLADICKTPEERDWRLARFVQDPESLVSAHNGMGRGGYYGGGGGGGGGGMQNGMDLLMSLGVEERYAVAGRVASR